MSITIEAENVAREPIVDEDFGPIMEVVGPSVNLCEANAASVLALLDVSTLEFPGGDMDGADFLGRVLVAIGTLTDAQDEAYAPIEDSVPGQATWVDPGRREGYVSSTLYRLHEVAMDAVSRGEKVIWG